MPGLYMLYMQRASEKDIFVGIHEFSGFTLISLAVGSVSTSFENHHEGMNTYDVYEYCTTWYPPNDLSFPLKTNWKEFLHKLLVSGSKSEESAAAHRYAGKVAIGKNLKNECRRQPLIQLCMVVVRLFSSARCRSCSKSLICKMNSPHRKSFESLRHLTDPEHPNLSLEQLKVVEAGHVWVNEDTSTVFVRFTPTVPTCSVATLIGLTIKAKLLRSLPQRFKVDVEITPGTHNTEDQVNKQLADKERVAAALENPALRNLINNGIAGTDKPDISLLLT